MHISNQSQDKLYYLCTDIQQEYGKYVNYLIKKAIRLCCFLDFVAILHPEHHKGNSGKE